jgi:hypothetical protein
MRGDWNDSLPSDEALLFFHRFHDDAIAEIRPILATHKYSEVSQIMKQLGTALPQGVAGLLQLALSLRYFHPAAAIANPIPRHHPILRGWSVTSADPLPGIDEAKFPWQLLTAAFASADSTVALRKLRDFVHRPRAYIANVSHVVPNPKFKLSAESYQFTPAMLSSTINGRVVSDDPHDILSALMDGYAHIHTMAGLKETGTEWAKILVTPCFTEVYEHLPSLEGMPLFEHHDMTTLRLKWQAELKVNATDPLDFLKIQTNMINFQIFINLSSPEAKPTLESILEVSKGECPYGFYVLVLADMNNETEKRIVYSFFHSMPIIGIRAAIEYLLNGFLMGFEKAYRKTRPSVPWDQLPTLMSSGYAHELAIRSQEYFTKYNITQFTVLVNGHVIRQIPIFRELKNAVLEQSTRLMAYARRGAITNTTNFPDWYRRHGIPMDSPDAALKIDFSHRLSIDDLTVAETISLVTELMDSPGPRVSHSSGPLRIPVFFIDSDVPPPSKSPPCDVRFLRSENLSDIARAVLRLPSTRTVVGPLAFDHVLSASELSYALHYVRLGFMEDFPVSAVPRTVL